MQDMLFFDPESVHSAKFVFCAVLGDDCPWVHLPFEVLPPACLPATCSDAAVSLQITGDGEDIVRAAIRNKTAMKVEHIKDLMSAYGIMPPMKGSGKNKGVKKIDRVKVMVTHFFPNESPEYQAELVAGILNQKVEDFSETAEMILQLTAAVGQDEAKQFSKVRKDAIDELQTRTAEALQAKKLRQNRKKNPDHQESGPQQSQPRAMNCQALQLVWIVCPRAQLHEPPRLKLLKSLFPCCHEFLTCISDGSPRIDVSSPSLPVLRMQIYTSDVSFAF